MDVLLLLVEAALVAGLGTWMAVAVADNWLNPRLNEEAVAKVLRFDLMLLEYPEDFLLVSHRRITDQRTIGRVFRLIRLSETVAALVLLASSALLVLAATGFVDATLASAAAIVSTTLFTLIWAGFLIGGNYFVYWYCHPWSQSNHFMLLFWGFLVLIVLLL